MSEMNGKVALITGASRGIGAATAREFANAGARVALLARGLDSISEIAREIGDGARAQKCDVGSYDDVAKATAATIEAFGRLDVVINNAGMVEPVAHIAQSDPHDWGRVIDVNLKGVYYVARAALPFMLEAGGGTILGVSSGAAHSPVEAWSHYCTSKAGAEMLTRCLHKEYGDRGIRSIGLSPGTVATQMQREIKASGINPVSKLDWSEHVPPDWPAKALLWMATRDADDYLGEEISLREPWIRQRLGLTS